MKQIKRVYPVAIVDKRIPNPENATRVKDLCTKCIKTLNCYPEYKITILTIIPTLKCNECNYVDEMVRLQREKMSSLRK
jgi:hypothetical protein